MPNSYIVRYYSKPPGLYHGHWYESHHPTYEAALIRYGKLVGHPYYKAVSIWHVAKGIATKLLPTL